MTHCVTCGQPFGKRARCYRCSPGRTRARVPKVCISCGGHFEIQVNRDRNGEGRYCSRTCKHRAQRGIELVTGTRTLLSSGYVQVKVGIRKYKLEHRLVMECVLGRELTADEHVHHINGDKTENQPENLEVLSNADHQRLHIAQGDSGICARSG